MWSKDFRQKHILLNFVDSLLSILFCMFFSVLKTSFDEWESTPRFHIFYTYLKLCLKLLMKNGWMYRNYTRHHFLQKNANETDVINWIEVTLTARWKVETLATSGAKTEDGGEETRKLKRSIRLQNLLNTFRGHGPGFLEQNQLLLGEGGGHQVLCRSTHSCTHWGNLETPITFETVSSLFFWL